MTTRRGFLKAFLALAGGATIALPEVGEPVAKAIASSAVTTQPTDYLEKAVLSAVLRGQPVAPARVMSILSPSGERIASWTIPPEAWSIYGSTVTLVRALSFVATEPVTVASLEIAQEDGEALFIDHFVNGPKVMLASDTLTITPRITIA